MLHMLLLPYDSKLHLMWYNSFDKSVYCMHTYNKAFSPLIYYKSFWNKKMKFKKFSMTPIRSLFHLRKLVLKTNFYYRLNKSKKIPKKYWLQEKCIGSHADVLIELQRQL